MGERMPEDTSRCRFITDPRFSDTCSLLSNHMCVYRFMCKFQEILFNVHVVSESVAAAAKARKEKKKEVIKFR